MNPEQQPEQPVEQPFEQPLEQSVAQPPIQPVAAPTPPPKPKKKWLLPLLIVLGVIVLGGVAYAGYALGTSEKASKQTSNTSVESIKAAMATDEYKQAVAILLSTKVAQ